MTAQLVNPWRMAIQQWLDGVDRGEPALAFGDAWLRLQELSTADLELRPRHLGRHRDWHLLALSIGNFGRMIGRFSCAVRNGRAPEDRLLVFSCPRFSGETHLDLVQATLSCLYRLAPAGSELEVVLDYKLDASVSTLAIAGTYTDAGWGLNPKRTELISESPRLWIFRFTKN